MISIFIVEKKPSNRRRYISTLRNFEDENEEEDNCESILCFAVGIHNGSGAGRNEADVRLDAEPGQELGLDFAREFFDKPDGVVEQFIGKFI